MFQISRRSFIGNAAAIPFSLWLQDVSIPKLNLIRYDCRSAKGKQMLQKYAAAVAQMKSMPDSSPLSWTFQFYTHFVRGDRTKAAEIARVFPQNTAAKSLAEEMWTTCQAHMASNDESYFLPWHRMYVYFFERIVRKLCGDPSFTLPYWDYSAQGPDHGVIPSEFCQSTSPLYVSNRNASVNAQQPIDKRSPGALNLNALKEPSYNSAGQTAQGFCMAVDAGLHGNVHVLVGNGQNMGTIPWAARDPVFWVHHCNIDRLWASWNQNGGRNPIADSSWMNKSFIFADENGARVSATIKDFLDPGKLGYSYDRVEPKPESFHPLSATDLTAQLKPVVLHAATQVSLAAQPTEVALPARQSDPAGTLRGHVSSLSAGRRVFLVIRDLRANAQPGTLFDVYLNLPPGTSADAAVPYYVGSINFFDAVGIAGGTTSPKFLTFDITALANRQRAEGILTDNPKLTVIPQGSPTAEANPVMGEVNIVERG